MKAPGGSTAHDRHSKAARKVNKAARKLAGWLRVRADAVAAQDWEAAAGASRMILMAEADLHRARRAHDNAAQWAEVERKASMFRGPKVRGVE